MFDKDVKINPNDNGGTIGEHSPSDQFQADLKTPRRNLVVATNFIPHRALKRIINLIPTREKQKKPNFPKTLK